MALNDIFWNFQTEEDLDHLKQILLSDQILAETGTTQYAVALAWKRSAAPVPEAPEAPKSWLKSLKSALAGG